MPWEFFSFLFAIPLAVPMLRGELTPLLGWIVGAALATAALTGLALVVFGNLRPMRPLLVAHVASSIVAALFVVMAVSRRTPTLVLARIIHEK